MYLTESKLQRAPECACIQREIINRDEQPLPSLTPPPEIEIGKRDLPMEDNVISRFSVVEDACLSTPRRGDDFIILGLIIFMILFARAAPKLISDTIPRIRGLETRGPRADLPRG